MHLMNMYMEIPVFVAVMFTNFYHQYTFSYYLRVLFQVYNRISKELSGN